MKIAQIICVFPPYNGGMGNVAYNFSKYLAKRGHNLTVFTPKYNKQFKNKEYIDNFKIIRLKPWLKWGNAAILPQLLKLIKDFDIIHLHYPFFGSVEILLLAKIFLRKKITLIVHYHMDATASGFKGLIFRLNKVIILPILMRFADAITCASLDYIKYSDAAFYYQKYKYKFLETYFGVDLKKFKIKNQEKREKNILFVGGLDRAHYFKGLNILLKAITKLPDCFLIIVGSGNLLKQYKKNALELGINYRVKFVGKVDNDDLLQYYNNASVFVLPSINKAEAFGLVLLEAMACGIPVIASDLPGVRSVFENEKQGLLCQPGDVDDLTEKIRKILDNKDKAKRMGEEGRLLVEKKYNWNEIVKKLERVYQINL